MSVKTKFIPAPWILAEGFPENNVIILSGAKKKNKFGAIPYLAIGGFPDPEDGGRERMLATGHLVTAAPEIYSALEKAVEALKAVEREVSLGVIAEAEKALKKARGEVKNG